MSQWEERILAALTGGETEDTFDWSRAKLDPFGDMLSSGVAAGFEAEESGRDRANNAPEPTFNPSGWESEYQNGRIPASAMVNVGTEGSGAPALFRPDVAAAWRAAVRAAAKDGVTLTITDSYRTYDQQVAAKANKGHLAATPGTSNHGWGTAVDLGEGQQREWMAANGSRFGFQVLPTESWHFDYVGFSDPATEHAAIMSYQENAADVTDLAGAKNGKLPKPEPLYDDLRLVPLALSNSNYIAGLPGTMASLLAPQEYREAAPEGKAPSFKGSRAAIEAELWQGFMDAGRPDLAKMVGTKAFTAWIGAESGWRVDATSPANNNGLANDGLFQVWRGHAYNANGQVAAMSAYEQALLIARQFSHLTAGAIRSYAEEIAAGTYHGWG